MNFSTRKKKRASINLIPVINVVFLLLIFFIVQGSLTNFDVLGVDAPKASSGKEVFSDPIEIVVSEDALIINLEPVEDDDFKLILSDLLESDPEVEIMLKADANIQAQKLLSILKTIRLVGGKNIYIVTTRGI